MRLIYQKEIRNRTGWLIRIDKREVCEQANRGIYLEKTVVKRYYKPIEAEIK